jgi:hypothetical protein
MHNYGQITDRLWIIYGQIMDRLWTNSRFSFELDISYNNGLGLVLDFESSLMGRAEHGLVPVH